MGENTKIEWTDNSLNLWWGCQEVAAGCDNCYAKTMANRLSPHNVWGPGTPRMEIKSWETHLMRWQRVAEKEGEIKRVFVGSMMDIFEKDMPLINRQGERVKGVTTDSLRARFFRYLEQDSFPNLEFQLLTKRPQNIRGMLPLDWSVLPANVMIGTSISQDRDIETTLSPLLVSPFVGRRFVSIEPLLGPIMLGDWALSKLDWVIIGGESGPKARPMHPSWANGLIDECVDEDVPVFFKQWGEWAHYDSSQVGINTHNIVSVSIAGEVSEHPFEGGREDWALMQRVGKEETGSQINGRHYHQYPERVMEDTVF